MMDFAEALHAKQLRIIDWQWNGVDWIPRYSIPLRRPPRKIGKEEIRPEPKADPY